MPADFLSRVCEILSAVASSHRDQVNDSDRAWTRDIKDHLCALGQELGFDVSASGCQDADDGEWLFDLVWSQGMNDEIWALPLVMECEWSLRPRDIAWDFGKLLVAKADVKLFVFHQPTLEAGTQVVGTLSRMIRAFRTTVPHEQYLLACYTWSERQFEYTTVVA